MRFHYKALLKLMKHSYRGGGIKVLRTEVDLRDCFFLSGAGWALLIPRETCPGEIVGQLVTWIADLPRIGDGYWLVKGYDPHPMEPDEKTLCVQDRTRCVYPLGLKQLPLRTETDILVQLGDRSIAALDIEAFDVLDGGVNLGAFAPGVHAARWTDEDTGALFWADNDIGNVCSAAREAAEACDVWKN